MPKTIKICTVHSNYQTKQDQEINLKMQGGSPLFAYLWIDDVLYTVTKTIKQVNFKKTK